MSGGFRPSLRTVEDGVTPEASVLASEHGMVKRAGITLASDAVDADGDGNKVVKVGTVLAKVEASGKYVPYEADGEGGVGEPAGILVDATVNLKDGDVITGMLIHGSVLEARCTGVDETVKSTLVNIIFQ